ncbi:MULTISPECIES: biotin transporter BioY [Corynebacterium]|uniref:biotin transporter BioY n=1 Tax=Corynebacterium TaxID=1716 RepID=UPI00124C3686|nr:MULTISPECIES: biotin transporter BioY [Corynebacterium]
MAASPSRSTVRDISYIAVFTALIIVFAFVTIPGAAGVPIVLQNAIVVLAGLVLGGRRGFYTAGLFLLIGMLGLPVLAGGRSTLAALAGPTIGYLFGYLCSAFIAGVIAYKARPRNKSNLVIAVSFGAFVGLLAQYLLGAIGLWLRGDMGFGEAIVIHGTFLPLDALKFAAAAAIAVGVHSAFPDIMAEEKRRREPSHTTI